MSEQIRVLAFAVVRPGEEAAFQKAAETCVAATQKEPGCLEYVLHQDVEDTSRFAFVETWRSAADLDTHAGSDHVRTLNAAFETMQAAPMAVHRYRPVG